MATKAQIQKMRKRKARERRIRRDVNIRRNSAQPQYRLDVVLGGVVHSGVMSFKRWDDVVAHKEATEKRRAAGDEIVAGRVVEIQTGNVVLEIAQSAPKPIKGALSDRLADSPAAAKAIPDRMNEVHELGIGS